MSTSAIVASGTYKVFGKRPERAVERLRNGATREELRGWLLSSRRLHVHRRDWSQC